MKSFLLMAVAVTLGLSGVGDAEAKRLGGGRSAGMQRESVSPQKAPPAATPAQQAPTQAAAKPATAQPAAAPAAAPKRSWMGPLAGLAAGLGLAALASHFGFGEELASMLMIGLLVMAVLMVVGFIMRKRAMAKQSAGGMQYAGAGAPFGRDEPSMQPSAEAVAESTMQRSANGTPVIGSAIGGGHPIAAEDVVKRKIPADFDVEGFVRNAKVNFIRMQSANDAGNLDDLREFTSPEMFAEIKLDIADRKGATQQTDVVSLNAEVLDVAEEASLYVVSVRFSGEIVEERGAAATPLDEVWHLSKPRDGSRGWVIAGIQQVQ